MKRLHISLLSFVTYPLFAYFLGLRAFSLFFIAIFLHEAGHLFAIILLGQRVDRVTLSFCGFVIRRYGNSSYFVDAIIALSGPVIGLVTGVGGLLLGFSDFFAVCMVYSVFNFLPIYPLDGGCFLRSILLHFFDCDIALKISDMVSALMLFMVYVSAVLLLLFTEWNVTLLAMCICIFTMTFLSQKI